MSNRSEITKYTDFNNLGIVKDILSEKDKRILFIKNFVNENFGAGKFYSTLKNYGVSSSVCEAFD